MLTEFTVTVNSVYHPVVSAVTHRIVGMKSSSVPVHHCHKSLCGISIPALLAYTLITGSWDQWGHPQHADALRSNTHKHTPRPHLCTRYVIHFWFFGFFSVVFLQDIAVYAQFIQVVVSVTLFVRKTCFKTWINPTWIAAYLLPLSIFLWSISFQRGFGA